MKPMDISEYTFPVGNECVIPTKLEARNFFKKNSWKGQIRFGIAETQSSDVMAWGIRNGDHYRVVSAFAGTYKGPIISFTELDSGSRFVYNRHTYVLTDDKDFGQVIREMTALPSEYEVAGTMTAQGYKDFVVHAIKMYRIGQGERYLAPAWYIEMPEDGDDPDAFMPMFFDDVEILGDVPVACLNWHFMDPGDAFIHNKMLWQLFEDENGKLFVNKGCLSLLKK